MQHRSEVILPGRRPKRCGMRRGAAACLDALVALTTSAVVVDAADAAVRAGVPVGTKLSRTGSITTTRVGTVVNAKYVVVASVKKLTGISRFER